MSTLPYSTIPSPLKPPSPFKASVPTTQLTTLTTLLKATPLPNPTYESLQSTQNYGISHSWLSTAKARWEDGFNWRDSEERINSFPNFMADVEIAVEGKGGQEGFGIHFVGLFSERRDAVPVLLLHGWPGSFLEFLPMLDLFRKQYTPQTLPYHLIVPSMPGYAFSGPAPLDRELGILEIPRIYHQLMVDLGLGDGYVTQGGDLGSRVARIMGVEFEGCKAVHINACFMGEPKNTSLSTLSPLEQDGVKRGKVWQANGTAYSFEHNTRPSTIGLILSSSPLALLAWIGEKFLEWSDEKPELDVILESVMLYWLTQSGGRGKIQEGEASATDNPAYFIKKPLGYSYFPKEILPMPKDWVKTTGNLVWYREHEKGGHFAALEQPEGLKRDLEEFIEQVWKK